MAMTPFTRAGTHSISSGEHGAIVRGWRASLTGVSSVAGSSARQPCASMYAGGNTCPFGVGDDDGDARILRVNVILTTPMARSLEILRRCGSLDGNARGVPAKP